MDEEAGRFDIKLFADVFTDFDEILAALATGTRVWFMAVFNARQMFREWLTTGADTFYWFGGTQLFNFGFLGAGISVPAFLEQFALFCRELFALVGEANTFVIRQFKGQRLNLEPIIFGLLEELADPGCQGGIRVELGEFGG
jgi:hypothetical protein